MYREGCLVLFLEFVVVGSKGRVGIDNERLRCVWDSRGGGFWKG